MAQQTAVSWLQIQLRKGIDFNPLDPLSYPKAVDNLFEQAKAMEKEQIVNAWDKRVFRGTFVKGWHIETQSGEQYYNETYNK